LTDPGLHSGDGGPMRTRLLLFLVVLAALQLVRCGSDDGGAGGTGTQLPDVVYDGGASDEAWEVLYPRLVSATEKQTLQLVTPTGTVEASPPPLFTWGAQASRSAPHVPGSAWPLPLGPAVAVAHEPPVTGTVVLLEITGASTLRVFTDQGSWTPGEQDWQTITGGTAREISVRLYSAYLNENVVTEGPFVSPEVAKFQVHAP
jgi:hypothetical protein